MRKRSLNKLLKKFSEEEIEEIKSRYLSEREYYNDGDLGIYPSEMIESLKDDFTFNEEACAKIGDRIFEIVLRDFKLTKEDLNNLEIPMKFTLNYTGSGYDDFEVLTVEKYRYETEEEFLRTNLISLEREKEQKRRENIGKLKSAEKLKILKEEISKLPTSDYNKLISSLIKK